MSIKRSYISSPTLTFAILCIGLGCIVAATLRQNLAIAALVAVLPALLCILILHLRKPERFIFLLFIFNYFFTPLARYSRQDGLSVLSDVIWWSVLLIIIIQTALRYRFPWKQAANILTIGGAALAVYCLMEVVNPTASLEAWIYSRGFIYNTFLVSLITVLLATSYKQIGRLMFLFSLLTLIAILKGFWQKFIGFDAIEYDALMESGMYKTHLLPQITRYFSIFTDAGNYGSNMGFTCVLFGITGLFSKKPGLKTYYLCVSALSLYSMFTTGTRGAIVVPLGGLLLFALISKNIRLMSAATVGGICIYVFFAFTYAGESNYMIRRMRTAFRPNKDASYLVRKQNRRRGSPEIRQQTDHHHPQRLHLRQDMDGNGHRGHHPLPADLRGQPAVGMLLHHVQGEERRAAPPAHRACLRRIRHDAQRIRERVFHPVPHRHTDDYVPGHTDEREIYRRTSDD